MDQKNTKASRPYNSVYSPSGRLFHTTEMNNDIYEKNFLAPAENIVISLKKN